MKLKKYEYEPIEVYNIRKEWVIRKSQKSIKDLKYWIDRSKYLYNVIMYRCEYEKFKIDDEKIEEDINYFFYSKDKET